MAIFHKRNKIIKKPDGIARIDWSRVPSSLKSAFIFNLGGGALRDIVRTENSGSLSGSSWGLSDNNRVISHAGITNVTTLNADASKILPTNDCTILLGYKKTDSTLRQNFCFSLNSNNNSHRCSSHLPWTDGVLYFDYGGITENWERISTSAISLAEFQTPSAYAFSVGPRKMEIWRNGKKVTSNTAQPTRTQTTNSFVLGRNVQADINADLASFYYLYIFHEQLPEALIEEWTQDINAIAKTLEPRRRFYVFQGGAGTTPVNRDSTLQWDLISSLTRDYNLRWDILNTAQSDSDLRWNLLSAAQRDNTLQWDIRAEAIRDSDLRWNIQQAIERDADLRWDLLSSASKDSDLRWDLLNSAQADSDLRWDLLSAALRDSTLQWDIQSALSAVSRDIDLRWNLIAAVQQDVRLDWNLLNSITADSDIRWDILSSIARDTDLRWDIQSSLSSVSRDVQLQWSLIAAVEQALEARWDLLESVQIDADLRWHIAVEVARNLTGQWSLLSSAQKDATLQWDMIAVADNAVSLRWTIQSDAGSVLNPIFTLVIPAENRVLTIASEIRTIT